MEPPKDLEDLVRQSGWLRGLSRSLVGDSGTADDLVQDTLVSALSKGPGRDDGPWLKRVLRNAARQHWRGESRRLRRERLAARSEELPSSQELVAHMETQKQIIECVQRLAEPYRTAIVLRFYEGLSAAEIARRKRIPAATVRSQVARGLAELRRRMDERHGGRKAWSALLLPWLDVNPTIAGGAVLALTTGILSMSTAIKLSLTAAAAATVALIGYQFLPPGDPVPQTAVANEASDPERVRPGESPGGRETPALEASRRALEEAPALPADPAADGESLRARIVDSDLRPLTGAVLRVDSLAAEALSDADGVARLAFPLQGDGRYGLSAALDGYATVFFGADLAAGALNDLGDIVLHAGGRISGRVEDTTGAPVAGARILVDEARLRFSGAVSRRAGPEQHSRKVETLSGSDGSFQLAGVAVGAVRVWAGHPDTLWSFSEPIELSAHETVDDLVLRLDAVTPDDVLTGTVYGADGRPVAGSEVRHDLRGVGIYATRFTRTDAAGRFRLYKVPRARNDLRAEDPEHRWSHAWLRDARSGAELVLRFVETRVLPIRVLGTGGAPLDDAEIQAIAQFETDTQLLDWGEVDPDGLWTMREPAAEYRLRIRASGHAAVDLGPYQPGSVPSPFEVRLEPASGIRGRVLADGEPVPGARVELYTAPADLGAASSFPVIYHHGFLVLRSPYVEDTTTSGADGEFNFAADAGSYFVRAEHDDYASGELEVRDFDPRSPGQDLELQLTSGGAIEGRVIPPAGEEPVGIQVVASRGDGKHRVQRVGADGRFRFERLIPGRWDVRAVEDDLINQTSTVHTIAKAKPELPWVCEVFAGETTRYDVDLSTAGSCIVAGRVTVDGKAAAGWAVELRSRDEHSGLPSENPHTVLDALGRFELGTGKTGAHRLIVRAPEGEDLELQAELDLLPGVLPWNLEIQTGSIEIENLPAATDTNESLWLVWQEQAASAAVALSPDVDGRCAIPRFPAGSVSVMHYPAGPWNPQSGRRLAVGRIEPGQTAYIVIP